MKTDSIIQKRNSGIAKIILKIALLCILMSVPRMTVEAKECTCNYGGTAYVYTVSPTCTREGYSVKKCSVCNNDRSSHYNIKGALGHDLKTVRNATCSSDGEKKCQRSGCNYTEKIKATGKHTPSSRTKKEATCTSTGIKEKYCTICETVLDSTVTEKLGHDPQMHDPTCCEDAYKTCKREGCTYHFTISGTATGIHKREERIVKKATCICEGEREVYCKNSGKILRRDSISKTDHEWETVEEATCNNRLKEECRECSMPREGVKITFHKHDYIPKIEPTCFSKGKALEYCPTCKEEIRYIDLDTTGWSCVKI